MSSVFHNLKSRAHGPVLALAVLLILSGLTAGMVFGRESRRVIIRGQEDNLFDVARSTDRNVANLIKRCMDEVFYLSNRSDFASAETMYVRDGASSNLWFWLRDNTMTLSRLNAAIIAMQDGHTVLSSHSEYLMDYRFFSELGSDVLKLCQAPDGQYYLAFLFRSPARGLQYAALMDLQEFYRQIAGAEITEGDAVFLYNEEFDLLISNFGDGVHVDRPGEEHAAGRNENAILVMKSFLENRQERSGTYDYTDINNDSHKEYVAVYPVQGNENGIFTVAVATPYDRLIQPLTRANYFLLLSGLIMLAGFGLVMYEIFRLQQERQVSNRKLEELRQQNESMEQLIERTKELEHMQRLELIGTMTSGIAHEFNNLLTPIMGYSIMTLEKIPEEDTELSENVIEIYNASLKAKDVIRKLSEISRKNPSAAMLRLSPDEVLRKAMEMSMPAKPKPVEIEIDTECGSWCFMGNETQITQLLLNLIINAYHAMEENGGTLRLSSKAISVSEEVVFRIADSGTGIPEDVLPHIFDPFFTTKEVGKGTGLGLAIVKNVAEQHGGTVEVRSVPGKGSTFIVRLPGIRPEQKDTR
ncbi:MAG: hypothetical protein IKE56_08275 [Lachnospiraceae bacterium]|nr:hypothetical protein [Lachnospiraceae bacterium]